MQLVELLKQGLSTKIAGKSRVRGAECWKLGTRLGQWCTTNHEKKLKTKKFKGFLFRNSVGTYFFPLTIAVSIEKSWKFHPRQLFSHCEVRDTLGRLIWWIGGEIWKVCVFPLRSTISATRGYPGPHSERKVVSGEIFNFFSMETARKWQEIIHPC